VLFSSTTAGSGSSRSLTDRLSIVLFVAGLAAVAFGYGVLVGVYEWYPYDLLREARQAAVDLRKKYDIDAEPFAVEVAHERAGVTVYEPERAFDGYTFVTAWRDGRQEANLIDMRGNVLHEWHAMFSEVWPEAPHIVDQAPDAAVQWHGAHLFDNGDVLFNFESGNFPFGGGLVKIDKNSRVLWALARNTHHDMDVMDDGTIYVPAHRNRTEPYPDLPELKPPFYEDVILKVSPGGKVLDELSILDALQKSDYRGLIPLVHAEQVGAEIVRADPTHLNNVEILRPGLAGRFPMFEAGDMLVSLRDLSTIAVIDPDSRVVKWALTGLFVRQHDPDFLANGHIMLFDNLGGSSSGKASQILEIDPATQKIVWRYQGSGHHPFYSRIRGMEERLPNGNVLINESGTGRVFEVTGGPQPEIVWEYYNRLSDLDGQGRIGIVTWSSRVRPDDLTFLN
jgi:hypothetical protein